MFDIQVLLHACTLVLLMQAQLGGAKEVQENAEDGICILHITVPFLKKSPLPFTGATFPALAA